MGKRNHFKSGWFGFAAVRGVNNIITARSPAAQEKPALLDVVCPHLGLSRCRISFGEKHGDLVDGEKDSGQGSGCKTSSPLQGLYRPSGLPVGSGGRGTSKQGGTCAQGVVPWWSHQTATEGSVLPVPRSARGRGQDLLPEWGRERVSPFILCVPRALSSARGSHRAPGGCGVRAEVSRGMEEAVSGWHGSVYPTFHLQKEAHLPDILGKRKALCSSYLLNFRGKMFYLKTKGNQK